MAAVEPEAHLVKMTRVTNRSPHCQGQAPWQCLHQWFSAETHAFQDIGGARQTENAGLSGPQFKAARRLICEDMRAEMGDHKVEDFESMTSVSATVVGHALS
eukprot:3693122-Amphidinium_carterae.1